MESTEWCVLAIEGDLDLVAAPDLRVRLADAAERAPLLVLDLTNLDFVDSTGLGVLVGTHRRLRDAGGEMRLAGASARIQRVLSVTGLDQVFSTFPTVGDAVAAAPEGSAGDHRPD
jgi:anti-sigma B factor antagonist